MTLHKYARGGKAYNPHTCFKPSGATEAASHWIVDWTLPQKRDMNIMLELSYYVRIVLFVWWLCNTHQIHIHHEFQEWSLCYVAQIDMLKVDWRVAHVQPFMCATACTPKFVVSVWRAAGDLGSTRMCDHVCRMCDLVCWMCMTYVWSRVCRMCGVCGV